MRFLRNLARFDHVHRAVCMNNSCIYRENRAIMWRISTGSASAELSVGLKLFGLSEHEQKHTNARENSFEPISTCTRG